MESIIIRKKTVIKESTKILVGRGFNPNFDGNALAWYDGNFGLSNTVWEDQGAGGHDIIFTNTPTIVAGATPLRDAVRFDGINQNGAVVTPNIAQPYTIYCVLNTLTWFISDFIFDDGVTNSAGVLYHRVGSPKLAMFAGAADLFGNPDLALGTWGVMTTVFNGLNCKIRTNLNVEVSGNSGALNRAGITIGSQKDGTRTSNCEMGYLTIRTGADSTVIQNKVINGLRHLCGLIF